MLNAVSNANAVEASRTVSHVRRETGTGFWDREAFHYHLKIFTGQNTTEVCDSHLIARRFIVIADLLGPKCPSQEESFA
jgi:hypothetical protein